MADKLKTCPFCGSEAKYHDSSCAEEICEYVSCLKCNAQSPLMYRKGEAVEWWNRRPSPWHTGTPTEEGFWLVKYKCVVEGKYNGRLTYRAVKIEKDKIDGFAYESGGIGAEEYWKPIEYQKIDDLWRGGK